MLFSTELALGPYLAEVIGAVIISLINHIGPKAFGFYNACRSYMNDEGDQINETSNLPLTNVPGIHFLSHLQPLSPPLWPNLWGESELIRRESGAAETVLPARTALRITDMI